MGRGPHYWPITDDVTFVLWDPRRNPMAVINPFNITFLWSLLRLSSHNGILRRPLHRRFVFMAIEVGIQFLILFVFFVVFFLIFVF